ncbi:MAG: metallophosphoesterase family protein [Promethearchaeota archaeon]
MVLRPKKNYFKIDISKKRKRSMVLISSIAFTLGIISLVLLFTNIRTISLMEWTQTLNLGWVIIILFSVLSPLYTILDAYIAMKNYDKRPVKIPSKLFITFGILGILFPSALLGGLTIPYYWDSGDKAPQLILISETGNNGIPNMAVVYWTKNPADIDLKFGTSAGNLNQTIADLYEGASKQHAFYLADLMPNTQYFYQIDGKGTIYNFTTMPGTDDDLHFGISSDCHFGAGTNNVTATENILKYISDDANDFDTFFVDGDLVEFGFIDSMWKQYLDTTSPYFTHIPSRPIIGNHDGFFGGENLFMRYLYPDKLNTSSGSRLYYKIEINNIHIFMLDLEWDTRTYTQEQKRWFEEEISKVADDEWVIVINHAMYYSSGVFVEGRAWWDIPDMINEFEQIFIDHDVDLVFTGHNHHLEFLNNSGIAYIVEGGFGGKLDPVRDQVGTGSLWYLDHQFGFVDVDISGKTATLSFRTPEGALLKSLTINE